MDGFSIRSLCLARATQELARALELPHDHSLKLQVCFLPTLEFHTLHTSHFRKEKPKLGSSLSLKPESVPMSPARGVGGAALHQPGSQEHKEDDLCPTPSSNGTADRDLYCHPLAFVGVPDMASVWREARKQHKLSTLPFS